MHEVQPTCECVKEPTCECVKELREEKLDDGA